MVCLQRPDRYAIEGGRIVSSRGLDFAAEEWQEHVIEEHVSGRTRCRRASPAAGATSSGRPRASP